MARVTADEVRGGLEVRSRRILYRHAIIGYMACRGARSACLRGGFVPRKEFVGRINAFGLSIEEIGSSPEIVLARISRQLTKAINDGRIERRHDPSEVGETRADSNPVANGFVLR